MRKLVISVMMAVLFLVGCSSNNEETLHNDQNDDINTSENLNDNEELDDNDGENNEEENEPYPMAEVVFSEVDEEPTLVDELDDTRMTKIDDEEIAGQAIVYGDGEVVSIKLNRTYRYDVDTKKVIWEARNWDSFSQMFSLKDGVLHYRGFSNLKGDVKTGDIVEKIEFDDEVGYENYVQYNEPYRIGLTNIGVQVTNEETDNTEQLIDGGDYIATALMENVAATELDNVVTTFDSETGEQLAEKEFEGTTEIFSRDGTDELYAIVDPVENQYGYNFILLDGTTLEEKASYFVNNANGGLYVANDVVFYYDPMEETIVALDGELTEELYRIEASVSGDPIYYTYGDSVYFIDHAPQEPSKQNLLQINAQTGEMEQFIQFPDMFIREFYILDDKMYVQIDGDGTEFEYYVIDEKDVHRSMDK